VDVVRPGSGMVAIAVCALRLEVHRVAGLDVQKDMFMGAIAPAAPGPSQCWHPFWMALPRDCTPV